jgi:hypothetical protein
MDFAGAKYGDATMRYAIAAAALAAFGVMSASGAQAEEWCGYAAKDNAIIECGYSTADGCETAVGKGGMCFINPDYASLNGKHATPLYTVKASTRPS